MIDARSLHELGVESLDSERTDDALNCFEMALDLDPGFVDAHLYKRKVHYGLSEYDKAIAHFDEAMGLVS